MDIQSVILSRIEINDHARYYRDAAIRQHGSEEKHNKVFPMHEWQRLSFIYDLLTPGGSCMEIGPGRGHFTRMLARSGLWDEIKAIDIVERRAMPKAVSFRIGTVTGIEEPDKSFDTVLCMEVLEHLDDADLLLALAELKRICRGQLLISVPFNEINLPPYHLQRFDDERLDALFPGEQRYILQKPNRVTHWVVIDIRMG